MQEPYPTDLPGEQRIKPPTSNQLSNLWEALSRAGLAEISLRLGTHVLLIALILLLAWGLRSFYLRTDLNYGGVGDGLAMAANQPSGTVIQPSADVSLPVFDLFLSPQRGITRIARLHTDVPSLPRSTVSVYTVQAGDTLFGIADKFGLQPETILWSNQFVLGDNPHNLRPGQELNILPVNGAYHRWSAGDGLNGVSKFFGVDPTSIINYPSNNLNPETIGDWSAPNIPAGAWLVIPGGRREFVNWSAPDIPRDNPGVAKVLGPGACESVANGSIGNGVFIWPANNHFLSGFDYNPSANHPGIDIDGEEGDPVYAADSGVIVYAGWNNWGYGNMIVINHGNGWQTLYAHLSSYYVGCGQSVAQGGVIGTIGSTGNSTGSHLHFEMMLNGTKINPHDYLK
ncbi:MAG TPA: M23 family metallopeptidase [Anaerolineales bacterium]|nr:M23 family metallopeptidase [Anaerolineales bacterium]